MVIYRYNVSDKSKSRNSFHLQPQTEHAFSTMSLIKTSLCNKIENEFLSNCMVVYAEREIADTIDPKSIIDEFYCLKLRKIQL